MLILTRKERERFRISLPDGRCIWVMIAEVGDKRARLGFGSPPEYRIDRKEILPAELRYQVK
jgi:sRNA-binding carbon storage regulator CsrA